MTTFTHEHSAKSVTHKAGHYPKYVEGCETCDYYQASIQRDIFAAARLVRDSQHLRHLPSYTDERAMIALAYVQNQGAEYATAEQFDEMYQGNWDTFEDYVEDYVESTGMLDGMPENLRYYFDYEKYARDLLLGGDYTSIELPDYRVMVLNNHA